MNKIKNTSKETDVRYMPSYSVTEAALYLRLPSSTLRAWIGRQSGFEPLISPAQEKPLTLSFINLIEAYVLASIRRKHRVSINKMRKGLNHISQNYPSQNPLAEKNFETDGLRLFLRQAGLVYEISREHGQIILEKIIKDYMQRIERDLDGLPIKLYPFSGSGEPNEPRSILIDPKISFGHPILSDINIPVEIIAERHMAGESIEEMAGIMNATSKKLKKQSDINYGKNPLESITFFLYRTPVRKGVLRVSIKSETDVVKINKNVKTPIDAAVPSEAESIGTVEGRLEFLNIHGGGNLFRIYSPIPPEKVDCFFSPDKIEQAREAVGRKIRVLGKLTYPKGENFPRSVKVVSIELLPEDDDLPSLGDLRGIAPDITGDLSSEEFVRNLRDAE